MWSAAIRLEETLINRVFMSDNKVTQKNIHVAGHNAGRDVNVKTNVYSYTGSVAGIENIHELVEKFKDEYKSDQKFHEIIERLENFMTPLANETVIGLEQKLIDGGHADILPFARMAKELFAKRIAKYQMYKSAQEIYVCLLASIFSKFNFLVMPLIVAKKNTLEIRKVIQIEIIDHIKNILGENALKIYEDEIHGMLFFLTGNCHIRWSP